MTGEPDEAGILPRSLDVIFNSIADVQALKYVRASLVELAPGFISEDITKGGKTEHTCRVLGGGGRLNSVRHCAI